MDKKTTFFAKADKLKPFYDGVYKIILFVCKLLLLGDVFITSMSVLGRYVSFVPDPSWSEEIVLTLMAYMAVLSAALAIRKGAHIRMTAFDKFFSKKVLKVSDLLGDTLVCAFGVVMLFVGISYANAIGAKGVYVSLPSLSKFWMYFPVPLAGLAMVIFEMEAMYKHIKALVLKEV